MEHENVKILREWHLSTWAIKYFHMYCTVRKQIDMYQCVSITETGNKSNIQPKTNLRKDHWECVEMHHLFIDFKADDKDQLLPSSKRIRNPWKSYWASEDNNNWGIRARGTSPEPLNIFNGVHKGDELACLLF